MCTLYECFMLFLGLHAFIIILFDGSYSYYFFFLKSQIEMHKIENYNSELLRMLR